MRFTCLVATLNRPEQLRVCIENLLRQTYSDFEIIVVDQSDDDRYDPEIRNMSEKIRYIRIRERGLSHARNVGIQVAQGEYICLVDDDGLYEPNVLETAAGILEEFHPAVLGGRLEDPDTGSVRAKGASCYVGWHCAFRYPVSSSMMIQREFLKRHPFDEQLGIGARFGCCEETDIVLAALKDGQKVFYTDRFTVKHKIDKDGSVSLQRIHIYAYGQGAMYRKMIQAYSPVWGLYYFLRSCLGNLAAGYLILPWKNPEKAKLRQLKLKRVWQGFSEFKHFEAFNYDSH